MSFWVWDQASLSPADLKPLQEAKVTRLYWQVGDLRWEKGSWRARGPIRPLPQVPAIGLVPVFRLAAGRESATGDFAALGRQLAEYAAQFSVEEVQIDYDCPDASLARYAAGLARCRAALRSRRITATALAGWPRLAAFADLCRAVDELFPMFYDLDPDQAAEVRNGRFAPLVDEARDLSRIAAWKDCPIPWSAGFPSFDRLSLFNADGTLDGHLRSWSWRDLIFSAALPAPSEASTSVTLWKIDRSAQLGSTRVAPGQSLVLRMPDPLTLERLAQAAIQAGARQIVWFRLPDGGAQTVTSVSALTNIIEGKKTAFRLLLKADAKGRWLLLNEGPTDLLPRVTGRFGPQDRGWQLEIDAPAPGVFLGANAGEFVQVGGFQKPETSDPPRVPVESAQRLTFWFDHLSAGESLQTGVILLNEDSTLRSKLRWRVDGGPWQPLR